MSTTELRTGDGRVIYSDAPRSIQEALLAVLGDMPPIEKGGTAPGNMGGYKFRRVEDITAALKPLFAKHGVLCIPNVMQRVESERTTRNSGILYCVDLEICFRFIGSDGDEVSTNVWGQGTDSGDKATQKAVTSAFKTMLGVVFCISDSEMDAEAHDVPETRAPEPISPNRLAELESRCIAIDAQGGEGTVEMNRDRWRLPRLKEADAAALPEWEAMLTQVEQFLASQVTKAPDADGNERSAASNQANDEAAINSGKLDGPPAPADTDAAESEEVLRARIAAEVKAMKPLEVRTALTEGDLELTGNPTALRERLVAYRVWCALSAPETNGATEAQPTEMEAVVQGEIL